MNKKSRGFTLVEMLAVIAIISVITLIATITYRKVRNDVLEKQYDNLEALIETAAIKYSSKTGQRGFFVEDLIKAGYLEPDDDYNQIYDPRNNETLNCHIVKVKIDENDVYSAAVSTVEYRNDNGCDKNKIEPYNNNLNLTAKIHDTTINYLTSSSSEFGSVASTSSDNIYKNVKIVSVQGNRWTNRQLDITANFNVESINYPLYGDKTTQSVTPGDGARYIWNKNPDTSKDGNSHTTSVVEFFDNNYYLDVYTANDDHYQGSIMYKYDDQKPVIYEDSITYANPATENKWATHKVISFRVTDKDGVGVDRIYAGSEPCVKLLRDSSFGKKATANSILQTYDVNDIETGKKGENGEINVCAVDKLGNLAETKHKILIKIDIIKPHCKKKEKAKRTDDVIDEDTKYQYYDRTIRQYCYDNNRINGILVEGSGCDNSASGGGKDSDGYVYFQRTFSPSSGSAIITSTITIEDKVGHTKDCTVNVYVDRKAPNCSTVTGHGHDTETFSTGGVGSSTNWDISDRSIRQYCTDDHVGCRKENGNDYYSKSWHQDEGGVIYTDTITIYDKVPQCSQVSRINSNCSSVNINSNSNLYDSNNSRVCTVGVYIDHVKPHAFVRGQYYITGNKSKFFCEDADSGVAYFSITQQNTGTEKHNYDGGRLKFLQNGSSDVNFASECTDAAGNTEERTIEVGHTIRAGLDQHELTHFNVGAANPHSVSAYTERDEAGECYIEPLRVNKKEDCFQSAYDCVVEDRRCPGSDNNDGMFDTCCLIGADSFWGCKYVIYDTVFDEPQHNVDVGDYHHYIHYNGVKYYVAKDSSYGTVNGVTGYLEGGICLVYNCYMDAMAGSLNQPRQYICGNFRE